MISSVSFKDFRALNNLEISLSQLTLLTGSNGAGKTSVLEGLYCLFSETALDVAHLPRYSRTLGLTIKQGGNAPVEWSTRPGYNYKLFWEECPAYGQSACSVAAKTDTGLSWSWKYQKSDLRELDKELIKNNPYRVPVDASTEFAKWTWRTQDETWVRAQILAPDDPSLYILSLAPQPRRSSCKYFDFAFMRVQPKNLEFSTSQKLTAALKIINPRVTDVRLTGSENGLSVILDGKESVTLGTLGNGAVTWASVLIAIFDALEVVKNQQHGSFPFIFLIDEMGAGIHYSVMLDLWKYINDFIEQNTNIQFVFTSHSDDCIRAYCETFYDSDKAKIIRLHKAANDNKVIPTDYPKTSFENISNGDWEVRG